MVLIAALAGCAPTEPAEAEVGAVYDAGRVVPGEPETLHIPLGNRGEAPLRITDAWVEDEDHWAVLPTWKAPEWLEGEQTLWVEVTVEPSEEGLIWTTLWLDWEDTDGSRDPEQVLLRAEGRYPRMLVWPRAIDFGSVPVGTTATAEVWVIDQASPTLSVVGFDVSSPFSVDGLAPLSIQPESSEVIEVSFIAEDDASVSGTLQVRSNDPDAEHTVALSANTGVVPDPGTDDFDDDGDGDGDDDLLVGASYGVARSDHWGRVYVVGGFDPAARR